MANKGLCSHCTSREDLDSDGKVKEHKTTVLKAGGRKQVRCSGSGKSPLPGN